MPALVIDLQERFAGDLVALAADGREVFRKAGVRTRYQVGRADGVRVEVIAAARSGGATVELPDRGLSGRIAVGVPAIPRPAVSVAGDRSASAPAAEPFRYL